MKRIIFIGGIFTNCIENYVVENSKSVIQYAADTLQKCFIEGLSYISDDLQIFNLPYVGSYPFSFRKAHFKTAPENLDINNSSIKCNNVPFNNCFGYKYFSRYHNLRKNLISYLSEHTEDDITVIIYAVHSPFIKACEDVKNIFPFIKVIQIVPDLPEFMSEDTCLTKKIGKKIKDAVFKYSYDCVDGFIFLTEDMQHKINLNGRPYVVIEGMFKKRPMERLESISKFFEKNRTIKFILYSGTLAKRYGILTLLEAFKGIERKDIGLIIIGSGDSESIVRNVSNCDSRIIYLGQIPHEQVLQYQSKAWLLVNPRTSEGEFTKYSFPSKIMEYLASGTPTLINALPGIPKEYYNYCFQPKDESIYSLRMKIEELLDMSETEMSVIGKSAQTFIYDMKNPRIQCEKIKQLISLI